MFWQHSSELALRAALFLAAQPPGKLSPVHEIAKETGVSGPYLAKILRQLSCAGLVRAFRGPGGGMQLARAPQAITLASVVRAMEGPAHLERCALGLQACSDANPCPLHQRWAPLRAAVERLLEETTLFALVGERIEQGGNGAPGSSSRRSR